MSSSISLIKSLVLTAITVSLVACGAGSTKDPFAPSRIVVFGDALSDLTPANHYGVNDGAANNWALQVAANYSLTSANVVAHAAGEATIAGVAAQTAGVSFAAGDLVLVSAGYRDLIDIAEAAAGVAGTQTASVAAASALGTAYANIIRGLVSAGAQHVVALDMYNLSQTPYQTLGTRTAAAYPLNNMIRAFNDALKSNLGDPTKPYIGNNVRLGKAEQYINSVTTNPTGAGFTDATTVVCTSTAAAPALGITGNTVSSKGCTTGTLNAAIVAPLTYDSYVFADPVYLTPAAHRGLANNVLATVNW